MRKTTKYMTVMAAAAVMMLGSFSVSYAATGWVQQTNSEKETVWCYYDNSGKMIKNSWFQSPSSGIWYFFDTEGEMVTGWGERAAEGYWFDETGAMATGWRQVPLEQEETYGPSVGTSEKGYFYFGTSGLVQDGWLNLDGTWYYLNDGYVDDFAEYQMVYGEVTIDGDEYYFGRSNEGDMKKGLVKVISEKNANTPSSTTQESYYLYREDGVRVLSGWGRYNGNWYYVKDETGEIAVNGFLGLDANDNEVDDLDDAENIYYMDTNGLMKTGWLELGEDKDVRPGVKKGKVCYYFLSDGTMKTEWLKDNSKWYYLMPETDDENGYEKGQMVTGGLTEIGGSTYYFNTSGDMAMSTWKEVEDGSTKQNCYFGSDGKMYKAEKDKGYLVDKIGSKYYAFDENGYRLTNTTIYYIGNKWVKADEINSPNTDILNGSAMYTINRSGIATKGTYKAQ